MKNKNWVFTILIGLLIATGMLTLFAWQTASAPSDLKFDGARALNDVSVQVNFGPRVPNSSAHKKTIEYIKSELEKAGWQMVELLQEINGHTAINLLATRSNKDPAILLGAHYDSRLLADHDPVSSNWTLPVPGANDGASGVAVLLELARSLPLNSVPVALLFIDIEDNGNIPGWDWIQGSKAFADTMTFKPKVVVILDMIGDANLNIFMEKNSDPILTAQIWSAAGKLGYQSSFIPEYKHQVLDDHLSFIEKGIPAVDIIDIDYPYWHTIQDTPDKISSTSLQIVGETLLAWIHQYGPCLLAGNCPINTTP